MRNASQVFGDVLRCLALRCAVQKLLLHGAVLTVMRFAGGFVLL